MGARRDLLLRAPDGAAVLDIGCWDGALGDFLQAERAATLDGIEPNRDAARRAQRRYRRVVTSRVEDALDEVAPGTYDVLLLLDVLEHLPDPWGVLERCRLLLRPTGSALVSLPNVAHWSVRKALLTGRWEYRDYGIMDRTHLRFFSRRGAIDLLQSTGWRIAWESAAIGSAPLIRGPDRLIRHLARWPSLFAVQLLFEARPLLNEAE
jgi:SAM-dependent methyltransferase